MGRLLEVTLVLSYLAVVEELGEQLLGGTRRPSRVRTIQLLLLLLNIRVKTWQRLLTRIILLRRI